MIRFLKAIGHFLSCIFLFIPFLLSLAKIRRWAKKYQKGKCQKDIATREKIVFKAIKKYLYWNKYVIVDEKMDHLSKKQLFVVTNHKHRLDPLILIYLVCKYNLNPITFLAKIELQQEKVAGAAIKLIDGVFIDRQSPRSVFQGYQQENKVLQKGISLTVFPEGTRYDSDEIGSFNSAAFKVAYENTTIIQPLVIYGANQKIHPKGKLFKHIYVKPLASFPPSKYINVSENGLSNQIHHLINQEYQNLKKLADQKQLFAKK